MDDGDDCVSFVCDYVAGVHAAAAAVVVVVTVGHLVVGACAFWRKTKTKSKTKRTKFWTEKTKKQLHLLCRKKKNNRGRRERFFCTVAFCHSYSLSRRRRRRRHHRQTSSSSTTSSSSP